MPVQKREEGVEVIEVILGNEYMSCKFSSKKIFETRESNKNVIDDQTFI